MPNHHHSSSPLWDGWMFIHWSRQFERTIQAWVFLLARYPVHAPRILNNSGFGSSALTNEPRLHCTFSKLIIGATLCNPYSVHRVSAVWGTGSVRSTTKSPGTPLIFAEWLTAIRLVNSLPPPRHNPRRFFNTRCASQDVTARGR